MATLTQNITRFESHGPTVHVADLTGRAVHPARTHNCQPVVERERRPDADEDDGLCRLIVISQGAAPTADATTEPRPRLTNTIGSVQQTSVVIDESNPTALIRRSLPVQ